jgi:hypothetical protein
LTSNVIISDLFQKSHDKLDGSMKYHVADFMKAQHDPDKLAVSWTGIPGRLLPAALS